MSVALHEPCRRSVSRSLGPPGQVMAVGRARMSSLQLKIKYDPSGEQGARASHAIVRALSGGVCSGPR